MRSYSNYLLFEDILDNLPVSSALLQQVATMLIYPSVTIIEEDCGTLLGKVVDLNFELEGFTELATGVSLSRTRINTLLSQGNYKIHIRDLHSCTSKGGICRKCYEATFLGETAKPINTITTLTPKLNYQTDLINGNNIKSTFTLSQTSDDYYSVLVIKDGAIYPDSEYVLGYDTITFITLPVPTTTEVYTIHYYKENSEPLLGYISKTYSGGLLGLQPLPALNLILNEKLYLSIVSDGFIPLMIKELNNYRTIPTTFLQYIDNIQDKLEKIIFMLLLYAVYGNITL